MFMQCQVTDKTVVERVLREDELQKTIADRLEVARELARIEMLRVEEEQQQARQGEQKAQEAAEAADQDKEMAEQAGLKANLALSYATELEKEAKAAKQNFLRIRKSESGKKEPDQKRMGELETRCLDLRLSARKAKADAQALMEEARQEREDSLLKQQGAVRDREVALLLLQEAEAKRLASEKKKKAQDAARFEMKRTTSLAVMTQMEDEFGLEPAEVAVLVTVRSHGVDISPGEVKSSMQKRGDDWASLCLDMLKAHRDVVHLDESEEREDLLRSVTQTLDSVCQVQRETQP